MNYNGPSCSTKSAQENWTSSSTRCAGLTKLPATVTTVWGHLPTPRRGIKSCHESPHSGHKLSLFRCFTEVIHFTGELDKFQHQVCWVNQASCHSYHCMRSSCPLHEEETIPWESTLVTNFHWYPVVERLPTEWVPGTHTWMEACATNSSGMKLEAKA